MSHLELLKKYMTVVYGQESYAYLREADAAFVGIEWTDEEIAELQRIEKEIEDD